MSMILTELTYEHDEDNEQKTSKNIDMATKNRYFQLSCILESEDGKKTLFKSLLYQSTEFPLVSEIRDLVQSSCDPVYEKFQLTGIHEFKYKADYDKWSNEFKVIE